MNKNNTIEKSNKKSKLDIKILLLILLFLAIAFAIKTLAEKQLGGVFDNAVEAINTTNNGLFSAEKDDNNNSEKNDLSKDVVGGTDINLSENDAEQKLMCQTQNEKDKPLCNQKEDVFETKVVKAVSDEDVTEIISDSEQNDDVISSTELAVNEEESITETDNDKFDTVTEVTAEQKVNTIDYKSLYEEKVKDITVTVPETMPAVNEVFPECNAPVWMDYVTVLPSIDEKNKKMLSNIKDYGGEFTREYISVDKDENLRYKTLLKAKELSDKICKGADTDYDKVKKIIDWVTNNIYYDRDAAHNTVDISVISLENVLKGYKTTCAGYSNIFSCLCNMQGIYCVNLRGGTAAEQYLPSELAKAPINHEWNAVVIDGKWIYVDVTWCSKNYVENNEYCNNKPEEFYGEMTYDFMCYKHRIDKTDFRNFYCCME